MYSDCFDNPLNTEYIPDQVFQQLPTILSDYSNLLEVSNLICSKHSIKKIFDAFITETNIAVCFVIAKHQSEIRLLDTLDNYYEYQLFKIEIIEAQHDSDITDSVQYIKFKAIDQLDLSDVNEKGYPVIVVENEDEYVQNTAKSNKYSDVNSDNDGTYRVKELFSIINEPKKKNPDLNVVDNSKKNQDQEKTPIFNSDQKEDIYNLLDPEDHSDLTIKVSETLSDYENKEILENGVADKDSIKSGFDNIESGFNNMEYVFDDGYVTAQEADHNATPYELENPKEDVFYFTDRRKGSEKSVSEYESAFEDTTPLINAATHNPLYNHDDDLLLIIPTSTPNFPKSQIRNLKIINPIIKQAILQLFANYSPQNTASDNNGIVIGLFFIKDPNFDTNNLIKSSKDVHEVGVRGRIVSYNIFNDLSKSVMGGSNLVDSEVLMLNIEVVDRIRITDLYLPEFLVNQQEHSKDFELDLRKLEGINLDQLVTFAKIQRFRYDDFMPINGPYGHLNLMNTAGGLTIVNDESLQIIRKYSTSSLSTLRKLLKVMQSDLKTSNKTYDTSKIIISEASWTQFRDSFETSFELIFAHFESFKIQYSQHNILQFFKCGEDPIQLIIFKMQFLVEVLKQFVELKWNFCTKWQDLENENIAATPEPQKSKTDAADYMKFLSVHSEKDTYYNYYDLKFQELLDCKTFQRMAKLIYKMFRLEVWFLQNHVFSDDRNTGKVNDENPTSGGRSSDDTIDDVEKSHKYPNDEKYHGNPDLFYIENFDQYFYEAFDNDDVAYQYNDDLYQSAAASPHHQFYPFNDHSPQNASSSPAVNEINKNNNNNKRSNKYKRHSQPQCRGSSPPIKESHKRDSGLDPLPHHEYSGKHKPRSQNRLKIPTPSRIFRQSPTSPPNQSPSNVSYQQSSNEKASPFTANDKSSYFQSQSSRPPLRESSSTSRFYPQKMASKEKSGKSQNRRSKSYFNLGGLLNANRRNLNHNNQTGN
ncbi:hypothetical protein DASC09_023060 [Saccharomycopsis crataegensis]|uniref:Uncharacterized protein n=1 Tax=Saccharomycopsis crataegensis TaxID=43959 RepID=A0AAV5QK27_9ASCO|nr:hypothetical protein DASC09_023060 [Saccharomycopsis crataegensis]